MRKFGLLTVALVFAKVRGGEETTLRLYDGVNLFIDNTDGVDFSLSFDVRDTNFFFKGPSELLVKVYDPEGRVLVREVIEDDGVPSGIYAPPLAGWDQIAWYYEASYSRGIEPMVRWSAFSDPKVLDSVPKRTFTYRIRSSGKGVYRSIVIGNPDTYVTVRVEPALQYGLSGNPEWLHDHHDMYRRSYVYIPKGTVSLSALFLQIDRPARRTMALKSPEGEELLRLSGSDGLARGSVEFEKPGEFDDKILLLEVSEGEGDFLLNLTIHQPKKKFSKTERRRAYGITAVLAPERSTARSIKGGAIYHDGKVFWQGYQVRYYDWLKTLKPEDYELPKGLPKRPGFYSVASHHTPLPDSADVIMHSYPLHKNRKALNRALKEMFRGLMWIGPGDHIATGPLKNLAYEMGCYSFFYHRPAWRILQQTEAPEEAKGPIREFAIQVGDRLAFCRGWLLLTVTRWPVFSKLFVTITKRRRTPSRRSSSSNTGGDSPQGALVRGSE